ncbi:MAG: hypothetical protein JWQ38_227 [Flavipsychrobacter sp.]|nr:hypothetical protein [Flavipsychrobacter sp.]
MQHININGKITAADEALIRVDNGAFRYGYGLFETMLVQDGVIHLAKYHWERLFAGMKQLYFEPPVLFTAEWLQEEVMRTVRKNKAEQLCRVRLQIYAGGGGLYSNESRHPNFVIECFALEADNMVLNENGLIMNLFYAGRKSNDDLANLKSCNALIYALAARAAKEQKCNDVFILNAKHKVVESTIANVFWVKGDNIYTPPLTEGCVAGVMRRHIVSTLGFGLIETPLSIDDLLVADEVFLTNAIKKIRWVKTSGGISNYTNEVTRNLYSKLFLE